MVERSPEKAGVGGSIPSLATIVKRLSSYTSRRLFFAGRAAEGTQRESNSAHALLVGMASQKFAIKSLPLCDLVTMVAILGFFLLFRVSGRFGARIPPATNHALPFLRTLMPLPLG